ncbi:TatA/E family twin arginine-targeting protein translocase [Synechococcus sp. RedBA-s]|uniref:TatA/E family twin arginine-targeting protein translocase n=1 Tax=Synechococcus sp. RedBA-s TaxID=2823741 RepID=UPI0020CBDE59|nr:TatA/E family twin arginine-targeting protein translocase [Synechococcus sp. RedBA-s]MCP9800434.1 TatA/E family twin arginine-targeting protein translocase [Synechococcus sp. RedBA-s]
MNFFGIGLPEMAVIAAIGLLVFGPKRLPELGRSLGRTLKGFQSASREFEQEFRKAVDTETVSATSLGSEALAAEPLAAAANSLPAPDNSPEASAAEAHAGTGVVAAVAEPQDLPSPNAFSSSS